MTKSRLIRTALSLILILAVVASIILYGTVNVAAADTLITAGHSNTGTFPSGTFESLAGAPGGGNYLRALTPSSSSVQQPRLSFGTNHRTAYLSYQMKVRFPDLGSSDSGFTPYNNVSNGGNLGTCVRARTNSGAFRLAIQTGSSAYTYLQVIDSTKWYQIDLVGFCARQNQSPANQMDMIVTELDASGAPLPATTQIHRNLDCRNLSGSNANQGPVCVDFIPGTCVYDFKVYEAGPDAISLTAASSVAAGSSINLTVSATRKSVPCPAETYICKLYDTSDQPLSGTGVTISGQTLSAASSAATQTVRVRAETPDGDVKSAPVTINVTGGAGPTPTPTPPPVPSPTPTPTPPPIPAYTEPPLESAEFLLYKNNCGNGDSYFDGPFRSVIGGPGGGNYLRATGSAGTGGQLARLGWGANHRSAYMSYVLRVRFDGEDTGFTPYNNAVSGGNLGTCVRARTNGGSFQLCIQTGGSAYTYLQAIDRNKWYHIELIALYYVEGARADLILHELDSDGNLITSTRRVHQNLNLRNMSAGGQQGPVAMDFISNTCVSHFRAYVAQPDAITLSASGDSLTAGNTLQFSATATRKALPAPISASTVTFKMYNMSGDPINDPNLSITSSGLLTAAPSARAQTLQVRAETIDGTIKSAPRTVTISSSDILSIKQFGFNEAVTKLINFTVEKYYPYDNPISFISAVFDADGALAAANIRTLEPEWLPTGETSTVNVNMTLPSGFNRQTWAIKVFTWTGYKTPFDPETINALIAFNNTTKSGSVSFTPGAGVSTATLLIIKPGADLNSLSGADVAFVGQSAVTGTAGSFAFKLGALAEPGEYKVLIGGNGIEPVIAGTFTVEQIQVGG